MSLDPRLDPLLGAFLRGGRPPLDQMAPGTFALQPLLEHRAIIELDMFGVRHRLVPHLARVRRVVDGRVNSRGLFVPCPPCRIVTPIPASISQRRVEVFVFVHIPGGSGINVLVVACGGVVGVRVGMCLRLGLGQ